MMFAGTLQFWQGLRALDLAFQDTLQRWMPPDPSQDVVLVLIDDASLATHGPWPWSRHLHADLIRRLGQAGARAIGVDLILAETRDPAADADLASALAEHDCVVLPVLVSQQTGADLRESLPAPPFAEAAAALGMAHAETQGDGVLRALDWRSGLGSARWPHVVGALLDAGRRHACGCAPGCEPSSRPAKRHPSFPQPAATEADIVRTDRRIVRFQPGERPFVQWSASQILTDRWDPASVRGRWVWVGAQAAGLMDQVFIPVSGQPVPGVVFLAHATDAALHDRLVRPVPELTQALLAALLAGLPWWWLPRLSPVGGVRLCLGLAGLVALLPAPLFVWGGVALGTAASALGIVLAYPFWAWHRLEQAFNFLDRELHELRLQAQGPGHQAVPLNPPDRPVPRWRGVDDMQSRLTEIEALRTALRSQDDERRLMQLHVSHDIRLPLASALLQLGPLIGPRHPVCMQIARVQQWAEDYLQNTRAAQASPANFRPLDLVGLLHQAADDVHGLLAEKRLRLRRDLPAEVWWVSGQFDLLLRAVLNLLGNAIQHAPPDSTIVLDLQRQGSAWLVRVQDSGPGIAADQLDRLFEQFMRAGREHEATGGAGLGLHVVKTIVVRHGGSVTARSVPGETVFEISLPQPQDMLPDEPDDAVEGVATADAR